MKPKQLGRNQRQLIYALEKKPSHDLVHLYSRYPGFKFHESRTHLYNKIHCVRRDSGFANWSSTAALTGSTRYNFRDALYLQPRPHPAAPTYSTEFERRRGLGQPATPWAVSSSPSGWSSLSSGSQFLSDRRTAESKKPEASEEKYTADDYKYDDNGASSSNLTSAATTKPNRTPSPMSPVDYNSEYSSTQYSYISLGSPKHPPPFEDKSRLRARPQIFPNSILLNRREREQVKIPSVSTFTTIANFATSNECLYADALDRMAKRRKQKKQAAHTTMAHRKYEELVARFRKYRCTQPVIIPEEPIPTKPITEEPSVHKIAPTPSPPPPVSEVVEAVTKPYTNWYAKKDELDASSSRKKLIPFLNFNPYDPIEENDRDPPSQRRTQLERLWSRPVLQERLRLSGLIGKVPTPFYKCPQAQLHHEREEKERRLRHERSQKLADGSVPDGSVPYNPLIASKLSFKPHVRPPGTKKKPYIISFEPFDKPKKNIYETDKSAVLPRSTCYTRHHDLSAVITEIVPTKYEHTYRAKFQPYKPSS